MPEEIGLALFALFLAGLVALDVGMVVSLARPGDERRQLIVWKASTYTLLGTVGAMIFNVVEALVRAEAMAINPFTQLGGTAALYFVLLLIFKKKYGD